MTSDPRVRLDRELLLACARFGNTVAVVDDREEITFAELDRISGEVAVALTGSGFRAGLPVVVAVDNRCSDVVAQLAVWRAGGVVVPVHRSVPVPVLRETVERTGATRLMAPADSLPKSWTVCLRHGTGWVRRIDATGAVPAELDPDQALVAFTSGSTGRAKGVVLSHAAFASKLRAISEVLPFAPGERTLQVLQLNFTFGQWTTLLTLTSGGTVHLVSRFDARDVLRRLASASVPVDRMAVVPTMLRLIMGADRPDTAGSPGLWIAGGEPLAAGLGRQVLAAFPGTRMCDVFGLSETSTSDLVLRPQDYATGAGTIGRPSPGVRVRVVDEDGNDRPPGTAGELWISTPFLMTGYLDDPVATRAAMAGEWFRTGDLAMFTGDGAVELVGRSTFLISRGGHKLSPLAIETVISEHPDCHGVCAFGVPDPVLGQRTAILFTPAAGASTTPAQIRAWARERMSPYAVPDFVTLVDELPLGRTGKLDRLRARQVHEAVTHE